MSIKKTFTLVELVIAVSILAIGIVVILRSFVTIACALDTAANRIEASRILESKINQLELQSLNNALPKDGVEEETIMLRVRTAKFSLFIEPVVRQKALDNGQQAIEDKQMKEVFNKAELSLQWKEGNIDKSAAAAAYFVTYEEEQL